MATSVIRQDVLGLYLITNGAICRPLEKSAAVVGEKLKAHHRNQSQTVTVDPAQGNRERWISTIRVSDYRELKAEHEGDAEAFRAALLKRSDWDWNFREAPLYKDLYPAPERREEDEVDLLNLLGIVPATVRRAQDAPLYRRFDELLEVEDRGSMTAEEEAEMKEVRQRLDDLSSPRFADAKSRLLRRVP